MGIDHPDHHNVKFTPYGDKDTIYCLPCSDGRDPRHCCICEEIEAMVGEFRYLPKNPVRCEVVDQKPKDVGCRVTAILKMDKMAGTIVVRPPAGVTQKDVNLTHHIFVFSFGPEYPGMIQPLNSREQIHNKMVRQIYYINLVPTIYLEYPLPPIGTNQYSVTNHTTLSPTGLTPPGIFFSFELSPMMIFLTKKQKPFLHLVTRLCAVVGGTWVVAGLIYRLVRRFVELLRGGSSS
eukprot:TRINITY_DN6378_c0_g2_i5.p1 TRINITY_DN6378_c0_g2~~TRINITY_DN6378_c0_g2_i5.p1  ORF type:complete len:235 (-),score=37.83 TRINITY_DN6378_c0_g2_i5:97-801(-)